MTAELSLRRKGTLSFEMLQSEDCKRRPLVAVLYLEASTRALQFPELLAEVESRCTLGHWVH